MEQEYYNKKIEEFADYIKDIKETKNPLIISFKEIIEFDLDLGEYLLDNPDTFLGDLSAWIDEKTDKKIEIRIKDINIEDIKLPIKNIRKDKINKLIIVEGIVRQVSSVKPRITILRFECPSCGQTLTMPQKERIIKIPSRCGCGRRGKFRELDREYIDCQKIVVEEPIERLGLNEQPSRLNVLLFKDLTSPVTTRINTPGNRVKISGVLKEYGKFTKVGETIDRELLLEANYIEPTEESMIDISLTPEDIKQIEEFAKKENFMQLLIDSLAPDIEEYEIEKEAVLYHLVGGNKIIESGKLMRIGDIHMLMVADTGTAKTKFFKGVEVVSPKSLYVDATGTSGVGLTASVIRDDFIGGYAIEAGALVLANNGTCIIDEIDKMNPEDRKSLHIALSEQIVVKHKGNIHSTMKCETGVIGLANPKTGRFDDYLSVSEQVDMPPSLINRFDLIFPFKDQPEEARDTKIINSMLKLRKNKIKRKIDAQFFKKYIVYSKFNFNPELTEEAEREIRDYYVKMRGASKQISDKKSIVPITPRQGETMIKLTEASAKLRLSKEATITDVENAKKIMTYFLEKVGLNPETGYIDIEKVEGMPSEAKKFKIFESILRRLSEQDKLIHINLIVEESKKANIQEHEVDDFIEKMRMKGDLLQSKAGFFQLI